MILKIICPFCRAIIAEETVPHPPETERILADRDLLNAGLRHGKAAGCGNSGAFYLSLSLPPSEPVILTVEEAEGVHESA